MIHIGKLCPRHNVCENERARARFKLNCYVTLAVLLSSDSDYEARKVTICGVFRFWDPLSERDTPAVDLLLWSMISLPSCHQALPYYHHIHLTNFCQNFIIIYWHSCACESKFGCVRALKKKANSLGSVFIFHSYA